MGVQKTVPFRTNVSLCQSLFLKWNLCNGRDRDWQSYKKHTLAGRVGRMERCRGRLLPTKIFGGAAPMDGAALIVLIK